MIQNFFIKKGSELPALVMKTTDYNYFKYEDFYTEITEAEILFSMYEEEGGCYKIKKAKATIEAIDANCAECTEEDSGYFIKYIFTKKDTRESGIFVGEFHVEFKGITIPELKGTMILPIKNKLYINII